MKAPMDFEASGPPRRNITRVGRHDAMFGMDDETAVKVCGCLGGSVCLGAGIGLVILLCAITTLGPEEQVVITSASGKSVINGPGVHILRPGPEKEYRQATRLGPREYAVVKNSKSGERRHEEGPTLLWLKAYDQVEKVKNKIVLQLQEYSRLVDSMTGAESVKVGPRILVPGPMEDAPNGTESAIVLGADMTVLTMNKSSGMLHLITKEGVFTPKPYQIILEVRKATLLTHKQYALVKNHLTAAWRHELGPQLLKIGAYDELISVKVQVVLQKDQFMVLKDSKTGKVRVVKGPQAFVPTPSETAPAGIKKAAFLDTDSAVLVLNRVTGQQRLESTRGVFFPEADEEIIEQRNLIRVLPHQAVVVRDAQGKVTIYNGADGIAAFFLPPYTQIVEMLWSDFSEIPQGNKEQVVKKVPVSVIDLRTRKIFFSYEVPTSDNVKLRLDGTIFWKVDSVGRMMNTTSDPEGDVWHHSRSALIQAVSKITLQNFMAEFSNITSEAMKIQVSDGFYGERGVVLQSMELTKFETVDASTTLILQQIIQETINRINRLQVQQSSNEVQAASLASEIQLEKQRTALITTKAQNSKLEAESVGDSDGTKLMRAANAFIGGLSNSVPNQNERVALYSMHEKLASKNKDTASLASGNAKLFMTPSDLNLNTKV